MSGNIPTIPINLALQGGGAHGAFTWGVLDALLEDGRFSFEGVSGASAGAMNAACLAHGLLQGGREGARRALADFWLAVADAAPPSFAVGPALNMAPAMKMMLQWTSHLTPEQINPFDLNPLRDVNEAQIDFAGLREHSPVKLFIAATHANSGKLRLFRDSELTADMLLASACLPTLHRTIHLAGEPYWDGGYSANPAVCPLVYHCRSADILLVLLTPLHFSETPEGAKEIRARLNELAFNSTFLREMRMFAHLRDQIGSAPLPDSLPASLFASLLDRLPLARLERRLAGLRFHAISADSVLGELPSDSKLNVNREFFLELHAVGRAAARRWLAAHGDAPGQRPTLDLGKLFY
ncbi:MAG: patatin-like phospholipase family protein [Azonexus sp.]